MRMADRHRGRAGVELEAQSGGSSTPTIKGIVTSASMLAYGPAFREAVKIAKGLPKLDIGLHLNLSEGEPLVLGHKTLVNKDGLFWGRQGSAEPCAGRACSISAKIEREATAPDRDAQICRHQDHEP